MVFPQIFAFAATVGLAAVAAIGLVYYLNNQSQPSQSYSTPRAPPLKRSHASKYDPSDEDTVCTICLEQTKGMTNRWILPCKHSFHLDCLRKWTVNKQECPNCRKQF
ncbi:E3 ubiquitin-protein ligase RNF13-like [Anopheles moucheti]|uniref:E3 ubiquitin-protein ligase RNF13-like n=1 Tax=Anopheles moucheti TaxID=186751 RepID=UPI0022F0E2A4|nr:E3 ubiquitin-protein ligase RNF13-like [Anopheles moucheti]